MAKVGEKLWSWGHLEGSHNECTGMMCSMTPEQYAAQYHIPNAFIVSYGRNIQPPYAQFEDRFSALKQIKWSVLGDADLETNRVLKMYIERYREVEIEKT